MESREDKITSFICVEYCQFCDNDKCNSYKIMEKYQRNGLTSKQMKEVNQFELHNISCRNHIPNEGFTMFGHIIEVHYKNGKIEKESGWYSSEGISELWDDKVEFVEILFTDI